MATIPLIAAPSFVLDSQLFTESQLFTARNPNVPPITAPK